MSSPPNGSKAPVYGEVIETRALTPTMTRVVLGGDGLAGFEPVPFTDQYVNALFLPGNAPYDVPFDVDEARAGPPEHRPRGRRYTIRAWDPDRQELWIDFVVHGDVGFAGRWAGSATAGDRLQALGPSGGYTPSPEADWHLMVGDESALPAIAASLERLPAGRTAVVVAEVDGPSHELDLDSPADVQVTWVHRDADADDDRLLHAVEAMTFPRGEVHAFVHGEAGAVRAIRRHLLTERGLSKQGSSISPYWRRNHTDEAWRQVKAQWLAESETDV